MEEREGTKFKKTCLKEVRRGTNPMGGWGLETRRRYKGNEEKPGTEEQVIGGGTDEVWGEVRLEHSKLIDFIMYSHQRFGGKRARRAKDDAMGFQKGKSLFGA